MRLLLFASAVVASTACSGTKNVQSSAKPAEAAMATVTGTVFYLERVALPGQGAVVKVQLIDGSRADAPADVIAQEAIPATTQVPIPFSLSYDPKRIIPSHTYTVQARIEVDGKLRFISTTSNPVITMGKPTSVDVRVSSVSQ